MSFLSPEIQAKAMIASITFPRGWDVRRDEEEIARVYESVRFVIRDGDFPYVVVVPQSRRV